MLYVSNCVPFSFDSLESTGYSKCAKIVIEFVSLVLYFDQHELQIWIEFLSHVGFPLRGTDPGGLRNQNATSFVVVIWG